MDELLAKLGSFGLHGSVKLAVSEDKCGHKLAELEERLEKTRAMFNELAPSRYSDEKTQKEVSDLLMHWLIHGRQKSARQLIDLLQSSAL
jgi:hypothetical protein